MEPKISVIIPVYNVEQYLKRCLDSVINQTLQDIEIICINDGSTDNSLQILNEYAQKDSRIIIIDQKNKGVGYTRNRGLCAAHGEYLGFVDPDDYIDIDFYEKLYKVSENNTDIIKGNFDIKNINFETPQKTQEQDNIHNELTNDKLPYNSFCSAWLSAIYRKELIDVYKINFSNTQYLEDVAFLYKSLYVTNSFKIVDDTFYHYIKRENSLTNRKIDFNYYKQCMNSRKDVAIFLNQTETNKEKYLKFYTNKVFGCCLYTMTGIVQNLGFENFEYFANMVFEMYNDCKYKDDLLKLKNNEFVNVLKTSNIKKLKKFLLKQRPKLTRIQKIFSVKNWGMFKIISILGIEIMIPINKIN